MPTNTRDGQACLEPATHGSGRTASCDQHRLPDLGRLLRQLARSGPPRGDSTHCTGGQGAARAVGPVSP